MRYMGGKARIAKRLAATIHECVPHVDQFWDAFCGGLSMSVALSTYGRVISSDAHPALISLYRAVRDGWEPPEKVTRDTYTHARNLPDSDPLKAFCGVGCSFGGKWFGGYAEPRVYARTATNHGGALNYARSGRRAVKRDSHVPAEIACVDFLQVQPRPIDGAIYCDPPYENTTGYAATGVFDHVQFVRRVREWSAFTHVFVSEYSFSVGRVVWTSELHVKVGGDRGKRATERLFWIEKGSL